MAATAAQLINILPHFPAKDLSTFHVESLLGGGGFSHVVLARDVAGKEWALKLIPAPGAASLDDVDGAPLLLSEARIHLLLTGEPSVLPCLEAFKSAYVDERGSSGGGAKHATYMAVMRMPVAACSVEEWLFAASPVPHACQGAPGSLVDEEEVLSVWLQMVNAVHRCHAHGIIHKDIKLPNFLMDSRGKVQIMDFGLAQVEGVTPRSVAGTPWTMSPACLRHGDDGRAGDWWALGVVLYQLLQGGSWPFKHCWWPWQKGGGERMEAAIRRAVLAGRITFQGGARVSEPLKVLIRGLLQPDPNRRWQLRQVLAAEAVRPELLECLGQRFPELEPDMQALRKLQCRARDVQALGSDGGTAAAASLTAAGLATAGSAIAAAASTVMQRATALVSEGGALHWPPHWPVAGKGDGAVGDDGSSYRPLLDGENREEAGGPEMRLGGPPAQRPAAAAVLGAAPPLPPRLSMSGGAVAPMDAHPQIATPGTHRPAALTQRSSPAGTADGMDLLLVFPNEVPSAHPSPPATPGAGPPPQVTCAPGLVPTTSNRSDDTTFSTRASVPSGGIAVLQRTTSPTSLTVVMPGGGGDIHHAYTATLNVRTLSDFAGPGPSDTSASTPGPVVDSGEGGEGRRTGTQNRHSPRLDRRSLTNIGPLGSPLRGPGAMGGGAQPRSPSPRSRRSRTSLHDLFGAPAISQPLPPQLALHPHAHHQRALSGAGAGGLLAAAASDPRSGGGGSTGGGHCRTTWALPRRSAALLEPLEPEAEEEEPSSTSALPPQSSWVPPPPEAFASAAAAAAAVLASGGLIRKSDVSSPTRASGGGRVAAAPGSPPAGPLSPGTGTTHGTPGHHHQPHPQPHHSGLLARARRLFTDCLQRPAVKYDSYDGDDDYMAMPSLGEVS